MSIGSFSGRQLYSFVRDCGSARIDDCLSLLGVRGEVKKRKQHLAPTQLSYLTELGLLDLQNQFGGVKDLLRSIRRSGTRSQQLFVRDG